MTVEPKRMTFEDWMAVEVSEKDAMAVAGMTDERLANMYLINGVIAAIAGEGSVFWQVHAAVIQEATRRGLKEKGMLS